MNKVNFHEKGYGGAVVAPCVECGDRKGWNGMGNDTIGSPCTIAIFGASGDLTRRKLIPALYKLFREGVLPASFAVVGFSNVEIAIDAFRSSMMDAVMEYCGIEDDAWNAFASRLFYHSLDFARTGAHRELMRYLEDIEGRFGLPQKRIYYLAIPPSVFPYVIGMLGEGGLSQERGGSWARVVVEKPFGRDVASARSLNNAISRYFHEHQIFRIDHYLGKESVQNMLMFRFANAIFEPVWNRNFIHSVGILAAETVGVEHRALYYEEAGVIRDMFQNHMMQLLAMTAIEAPSRFEAERVRDEKVKLFRSLRPFAGGSGGQDVILGQYGAGTIGETSVPAYREEEGIDVQSLTPTFAVLKVFIDNWRWQGVPFYLASGKRLHEKKTEIVINFKRVPHSLFRDVLTEDIEPNRLIFSIQPDERIALTFQGKDPREKLCLRSVKMDFDYYRDYPGTVFDSYERVLMDVIAGDHMLFWRQDGVELTWSFLTPIIEFCESCDDRSKRLFPYPAGSWGPAEAELLMTVYGIKRPERGS